LDQMVQILKKKDPHYAATNATDILEDLKAMNDYQIHKQCTIHPVLSEFRLSSSNIRKFLHYSRTTFRILWKIPSH
jgi:hypothetical protein